MVVDRDRGRGGVTGAERGGLPVLRSEARFLVHARGHSVALVVLLLQRRGVCRGRCPSLPESFHFGEPMTRSRVGGLGRVASCRVRVEGPTGHGPRPWRGVRACPAAIPSDVTPTPSWF